MRSLVPALALLAFTGAAAPAAADSTTLAAEWGRICLAAKGDVRLASRLALAGGWKADPRAGPAYATHPGDFTGIYSLKTGGEVHVIRMLGEQNTRPRRRHPLMECVVTGQGVGDPTAAVTALLGAPAVAQDQGQAVWMLDGSAEALAPLHADEGERAKALAKADQAVIIHAGLQGDEAVIRYEGPSR